MKCDAVIEKIKARVAAIDPNGPRKVLGVFQLNIEAADGLHEIIVDLKALKVSDGKASSPDVVINLKDEDFIAIGTKAIPVKDAVAQGKVSYVWVHIDHYILCILNASTLPRLLCHRFLC